MILFILGLALLAGTTAQSNINTPEEKPVSTPVRNDKEQFTKEEIWAVIKQAVNKAVEKGLHDAEAIAQEIDVELLTNLASEASEHGIKTLEALTHINTIVKSLDPDDATIHAALDKVEDIDCSEWRAYRDAIDNTFTPEEIEQKKLERLTWLHFMVRGRRW